MNKKLIISVIGVCLLSILSCCKKESSSEPSPIEDPVPTWSITQTNPDYTSSMTMIMAMPESFTVTENDMMAVFSGDECVGLAKNPISTPYGYRFFLYVIKPIDTNLFLDIKMYSFDKHKLYVRNRYCKFWLDDMLGTVEEPMTFEL